MRLSYSVLLVLAIACLACLEGARPDRSLNGILKKKKKKAYIPAVGVLPAAQILYETVVAGGWLPVNYQDPVATVAAGAEMKYYFDGSLYYFLYEDLIGKFFFKDSTKYYTFLFDAAVIPSKTHYTADAGDVAVEGETTDANGGASEDVVADGGAMATGASTTAEATTAATVDTGGDGGYSASGDGSGYGASGYGVSGYEAALSKKKKKKYTVASLISGATVAYG